MHTYGVSVVCASEEWNQLVDGRQDGGPTVLDVPTAPHGPSEVSVWSQVTYLSCLSIYFLSILKKLGRNIMSFSLAFGDD